MKQEHKLIAAAILLFVALSLVLDLVSTGINHLTGLPPSGELMEEIKEQEKEPELPANVAQSGEPGPEEQDQTDGASAPDITSFHLEALPSFDPDSITGDATGAHLQTYGYEAQLTVYPGGGDLDAELDRLTLQLQETLVSYEVSAVSNAETACAQVLDSLPENALFRDILVQTQHGLMHFTIDCTYPEGEAVVEEIEQYLRAQFSLSLPEAATATD